MKTPCYCFDLDVFAERARSFSETLPGMPLCYSIKANPFLLEKLPEEIARVEVCSPGELEICQRLGIPGERILYSGVLKEAEDVEEAIRYGVSILTCESLRHAALIREAAEKHRTKASVLLRLTSGNQFGMSLSDIREVIRDAERRDAALHILGLHYYSGTQKNPRKIARDLERLENALEELKTETGFVPSLVEYGPGLPAEPFSEDPEAAEREAFKAAAPLLLDFSKKYPLGIELGRFLAAPAGTYLTRVGDLKDSCDTHYAILDGGIHHLSYYGQRMAMQRPPLLVRRGAAELQEAVSIEYCLCGSLCTVADVLVREVTLPELHIGDTLEFGRCGAYSVTEAPALFLSRPMPEIYIKDREQGLRLLRGAVPTSRINSREQESWN